MDGEQLGSMLREWFIWFSDWTESTPPLIVIAWVVGIVLVAAIVRKMLDVIWAKLRTPRTDDPRRRDDDSRPTRRR